MRGEALIELRLRVLRLLDDGLPRQLEMVERPKTAVEGFVLAPSTVSFNAVATYASLGHMGYLISALGGGVRDCGDFLRRKRVYEERLATAYKARQRALETQIHEGLRELTEWFEFAVSSVDSAIAEFPYDTVHEAENELFGTRELVEFASTEATSLGHHYDFATYLRRIADRDQTLQRVLPLVVAKLARLGGEIDRPEIYPNHFWWRRAAWDLYRQRFGIDDP